MIAKSALLGGSAVLFGGIVAVSLTGTVLAQAGPSSTTRVLAASVRGSAEANGVTMPHAYLELSTYPDSLAGPHGASGGAHPDWVTYGPTSNFSVPAHSLVTVTIKQYDTGGSLNNAYFDKPRGTVGGSINVDGKTVTQTDPDAIGHTFTIHGLPTNQDPLFVSVPLPAVADDAGPEDGSPYPKPHVITFSFVTGGRGEYVWNCEFPCGDGYYAKFGGPMSTQGYMSGAFNVA